MMRPASWRDYRILLLVVAQQVCGTTATNRFRILAGDDIAQCVYPNACGILLLRGDVATPREILP